MKINGFIDGKECAKQIIAKISGHIVVIGAIVASSILISVLLASLVSPLALIIIKVVSSLIVGFATSAAVAKLEQWLEKKITAQDFTRSLVRFSNKELNISDNYDIDDRSAFTLSLVNKKYHLEIIRN